MFVQACLLMWDIHEEYGITVPVQAVEIHYSLFYRATALLVDQRIKPAVKILLCDTMTKYVLFF